jgi:cyclopropane-fatty-acyl-phospholipid synthase
MAVALARDVNVLQAIMHTPLSIRRRVTPGDAADVLHALLDHQPRVSGRVRLWDGHVVSLGVAPRVTVSVGDADTFVRCFGTGDPSHFGEAYADGHIEVEGDIRDAVELVFAMRDAGASGATRFPARAAFVMQAMPHAIDDGRRGSRAHDDVPDNFFRLFLDERMVHSCAYYREHGERLEDAQARKLDLICRKLDLRPSDRFLDIGCGWGGLVIWAAATYGARAHGVTLSEHQASEARRRAIAAGVDDLVTFGVAGYRDLPDNTFNKIASVGMYEHVGRNNLGAFFQSVHRALLPGGLFLCHGITIPASEQRRTGECILRRVFPGSELETVPALVTAMEHGGFEVLDVHALRPHSALTVTEWGRRFQARRAEAVELTSEYQARVWEVYFAGCAQAFDVGLIGVDQILAGRPDLNGRAHAPLQRRG